VFIRARHFVVENEYSVVFTCAVFSAPIISLLNGQRDLPRVRNLRAQLCTERDELGSVEMNVSLLTIVDQY
jgi:hypothetical protein